MKISIILSLLIGLLGTTASAGAAELTYNITFTGGSPDPTGSFTFDTNAERFVSFGIQYDGGSIDLVEAANSSSTAYRGCASTSPFAVELFDWLTGDGCTALAWSAFSKSTEVNFKIGIPQETIGFIVGAPGSFGGDSGSGTFTVTPQNVATPEPATATMLFTGLALLAWSRRGSLKSTREA